MDLKKQMTHLEEHLQSMRVQMLSLLSVTRKIGSQDEINDLYKFYEENLTEFIEVEDISLFVHKEDWEQVLCKSKKIPSKINFDKSAAYKYRQPSKLSNEDSKALGGYKYIVPVYYMGVPVSYTLLGEFKTQYPDSEKDFILYAKTLTNILTIVIENKKMIHRELEKKDLEKDLELATKIQGMIIPKKLPKNSIYSFAGLYRPHRSIGGDYYDVININKDEFVFCIGDISGKGVAAALVMANLQAYLNAGINFDFENGRELIDRLNNKIYSITNGEKFITLFLAKYNIVTRELQYINAGHNPPFLKNGSVLIQLKKGCAILGILDQIPRVEIGKVILDKDAKILSYTDGLTEQANDSGEVFGMERVGDFVNNSNNLELDDFVYNLYEKMISFKGSMEVKDDVSILAGRFY